MSSIESRLKAMEAIVAQIDEANKAANDRNAPIRWRGGAEGLFDLLLSFPRRIDQFSAETEMAERQKYFAAMWCTLGMLRIALKERPEADAKEDIDQERHQEFIQLLIRWAPQFIAFQKWAKGFMTPDGKLDQARLLLHRNDCPVMV